MKHMIYADNAATTKLSKEALSAMMPYLEEEYGNASQPYSFSRTVKKAVKKARETIASCINALPEEIFFTSGGTESDNWALKSIMCSNEDTRGLLTSGIEHHAILKSAESIKKMGIPVSFLPVNAEGIVTPDILEREINNKTKLVSIMLSNNEIGSIQPVKELTGIAHSNGALFHTDAVQAVGHIEVDVISLGVDMLSASAHKFNGPKGVGFLYVRKGSKIAPFLDGGAQEFGMRAGTENVAAIVGMAVALKENITSLEKSTSFILEMENMLLDRLTVSGVDFIRNGAKDNCAPGNISLSFRGLEGEMLLHRLDLKGICVSTGAACDSKNTRISHVLRAIGLDDEYATGTIRISLGKNNTPEEVNKIADAIISIVQ